jgi:hypothetical protein
MPIPLWWRAGPDVSPESRLKAGRAVPRHGHCCSVTAGPRPAEAVALWSAGSRAASEGLTVVPSCPFARS